jgi:hypothetical protein
MFSRNRGGGGGELRPGRSGVRIPVAGSDFSLLQNIQSGSGAHPASCSVGTGCFLQVAKRTGREVSHSSPSGAEFKNEWSCTSLLPKCIHGVDRVKFLPGVVSLGIKRPEREGDHFHFGEEVKNTSGCISTPHMHLWHALWLNTGQFYLYVLRLYTFIPKWARESRKLMWPIRRKADLDCF